MSWPIVSLGEICELKYGKSLPSKHRNPGGVSVFGSNGIVGEHEKAITNGKTIVVGRKGSIGEIAYSEAPCWPIDTTYYIDELSTNQNIRWLCYTLQFLGLRELNKSAAIPGLNRNDAYEKKIPLPPLAEQRRIAAILDQADALRRLRRRALDRLQSLGQSIFHEMFGDPAGNPMGWPSGTIGDLLSEAKYGTSTKANTDGRGLPILRMGNVTYDGEIDLTDLKYAELKDKDIPKYTTKPGDILFNRTNSKELVGKTAVVTSTNPMAIAGYLVRARANKMSDPHYICAYLNSRHGKAVLRSMCKSIVGMANINAKEFQQIKILTPPVELQQKFSARLKVIQERSAPLKEFLLSCESLFTSLQHRAFRGEL